MYVVDVLTTEKILKSLRVAELSFHGQKEIQIHAGYVNPTFGKGSRFLLITFDLTIQKEILRIRSKYIHMYV